MNDQIRAVVPQIRMILPTLTPKEQTVVHYLLNLGGSISAITINEAAQQTGVSNAMIVKIAKKLGYNGFRELRDQLYHYSSATAYAIYDEVAPDDTPETILEKVFMGTIQALQETLTIIDIQAFAQAIQVMANARQRDFYGVGGSATIAHDAAHKFLRIGIRATAYDDPHMMMMSASLLTPQDVVLAISHSGQTLAVLEPVRLARQSGTPIIALVNYSSSTLAQEADIVLCSTARGSPLMGENAAARIAQLNILDALFVCVAQQDYAGAEQALGRTMSSVKQKREV